MWLRLPPALVLTAAACAGTEAASGRVPEGRWGGQRVDMTVTASSATLQFDCGHGSIDRAIDLDENGSFDVAGILVREHGGPVREGEVENRQPVRYAGEVKGSSMALRLLSQDGKERIEEFTLVFGKEGRIVRCL